MRKLIKSNISPSNWEYKLSKLVGKLEKGNEREYSDSKDKYKYNYTPEQAFTHYKTLLALGSPRHIYSPQHYEQWLVEYLEVLNNLNYHINDIERGIDISLTSYQHGLKPEDAADRIYYFWNIDGLVSSII